MFVEIGLAVAGTYLYNYLNTTEERKIKNKLSDFMIEKILKNNSNTKIRIKDIELFEYGFVANIDISGICSFIEIDQQNDYLRQLFRADSVSIVSNKGEVIITVVTNIVKELEYKRIANLPPTILLLGYKDTGELLTADMLKTPHLGVVGLSNNGKSKMIEVALNNLSDADIILINTFRKDFRTVKARRVNGDEDILLLLNTIIENKYIHERPLYLVIDELNILSNNKDINKAIGELLKVARHYNIYLICMAQDMLKETVKFKNLFNVRVCFRCIEESSYRAFLGVGVPNNNLLPREFYCLSDQLYFGKTYTIN